MIKKDKIKYKSQSYENKKEIIKKSKKVSGKVRMELFVYPEEKNDFAILRDILDITNPELLQAFISYCKDNNEFKRFVIDKEYLKKKETYFII